MFYLTISFLKNCFLAFFIFCANSNELNLIWKNFILFLFILIICVLFFASFFFIQVVKYGDDNYFISVIESYKGIEENEQRENEISLLHSPCPSGVLLSQCRWEPTIPYGTIPFFLSIKINDRLILMR